MHYRAPFHAATGILAACFIFLISSARAAIINVSYGDCFFDPPVLTVNIGDTVNWSTNIGGDFHTLAGTGTDPICGGDSLPCSYTFNTTGSFPYECTVPGHAEAGMTGVIIVVNPSPPVIITQPQSQTVLTNATVMFSVTASNATSYQWQSNTVDLPGATNDSLILSNVVTADSATYQVVVSGASQSVTSSNAVLVVLTAPLPVIITQPQSQTVLIDTTVTFSVIASNAASYQWQSNTFDLPGATNASLTLSNVGVADSATYRVVISNASGSLTSSNAVLLVLSVPLPVIVTQPQSQLALTNTTVMLSVTASNAAAYQWQFNLADIAGATDSSFVLSNVVPGDSGNYQVVVSNVSGSVTSSVATLLVGYPVIFTQPLANVDIPVATPVTLQVEASGSPAPQYQWFLNTAKISGQTNTSLSLGIASTNLDGTYSVIASNAFGAQTSSAVLTVEPLTSVIKENLTVTINPAAAGKAVPNLNGKSLDVAQSYTLTAVAAKGWVFTNWTGLVQSGDTSLTFVMPYVSNAVLTANFIPSPFANNGVAGAYSGLFWDAAHPANKSSGYFSASVADSGVIAGQVKIAGASTTFSTILRADGSATVQLKRRNQPSLVLTLKVDLTGLEMLAGTVSDVNNTFNAPLTAFRAGFGASHKAADYNGYYTWAMPGGTGDAPAGYSYGTATIAPAGGVRLTIFLSDGTRTTASGALSTNGQTSLYAPFTAEMARFFLGCHSQIPPTGFPTNDAFWFKESVAKGSYPNGFSLTNLSLWLGRYAAEGNGANALNSAAVSVQLSDADLAAPVSQSVTLDPNGIGGSFTNIVVTMSDNSGMFTGLFKNPVSGKTIRFNGTVLRSLPAGYGFFMSDNLSGAVMLAPP